ncbi:ribonuclease H-like domain-containing protein [Tanacetum coccineum]|uniref:Ribonuclease H-like domain-containing protein n=1 Tax=Tanacetum coccineum TaxID=301880 RepID=A0ABQ4Y2R3_9ASTR
MRIQCLETASQFLATSSELTSDDIRTLHDDLEVTAAKQYENFTTSSSEVLDQTFDRLQKLIRQLEIHGESISQEDVNQKFLRSLSPEWNTHTIMWRNKPKIDTLSLDDLYNNLKIYEPEVKGTSSSSTNTQNIAFVSSNSTSITNGVVNVAHGATTASTQATAVNSTTIDNLSDVVICAFFAKEMDLRWQMAMLTIRARRFLKNTRRKLTVNGNKTIELDKNRENTRRVVSVETTTSNSLVSCDGSGYDWSDLAEEGTTNFALMAYSSTSSNSKVSTDSNCSSSCLENVKNLKEQNEQLLKDLRTSKLNAIAYKTGLKSVEPTVENFENSSKSLNKLIDGQIVDKCKTGLGYNAVPPPYTGNFMPPKPDLSFSGLEEFTSEPIVMKPIVEKNKAKASKAKPKVVRKTNGVPIIEDWMSDNEEDDVPQAKIEKKTFKPSFSKIEFVKLKQQEKTGRKTVNHVEKNRQNIHIPRGNQRNWNNMMSQRLRSNFEMFNKARTAHSTVKRPIHKNTTFKNMNFNKRVNIVKDKKFNTTRPKEVVNAARPKAVVNAVKGNNVNAVKASACWAAATIVETHEVSQQLLLLCLTESLPTCIEPLSVFRRLTDKGNPPQMDLQDKRVIDSGCSRHMTSVTPRKFPNNCDTAFKDSMVAIAIVGRDSSGFILHIYGKPCHDFSPLYAEIFAIHSVCHLASCRGWYHAIVKSDSQVAISLSSTNTVQPWSIDALVVDIRLWSKNMNLTFS